MKIACIQLGISHCKKRENIDKALAMAKAAVSKGAKLLVFPEVFSTGFCYARLEDTAECAPYPTLKELCAFSKEYDCILLGSIIEAKGPEGKKAAGEALLYYNLGFCIEAGEIAGLRRKTHLYGPEKMHFSRGDLLAPIKLKKQKLSLGLVVCYELHFPEVARKLVLEGADLLVTVAEIPDPWASHWKAITLTRAIENQVPHIACNRAGEDPYSTYFGGSMIIGAGGEIKAQAGREECMVLEEIDLSEAQQLRKSRPIFEDRRPDLY